MDHTFALNFHRIRRRVLWANAIFVTAGIAFAADVWYLSGASVPGNIPTYGIAVLFSIILGTHPVLSYVLTRCINRWQVGNCPHCGQTLWDETHKQIQTALLQRCPRCDQSLRWRQRPRGFPVIPKKS